MGEQRLTNRDGSLRGVIKTQSNGDADGFHRSGSYAGRYQASIDSTYAANGSFVGKGNQLSSLIDDKK